MKENIISQQYLIYIVIAIIMGSIARILTRFNKYPSYPNGYLLNLVTGVVAPGLGAVALPALLAKNYFTITFLTLGIQHFRDVRKIERKA